MIVLCIGMYIHESRLEMQRRYTILLKIAEPNSFNWIPSVFLKKLYKLKLNIRNKWI